MQKAFNNHGHYWRRYIVSFITIILRRACPCSYINLNGEPPSSPPPDETLHRCFFNLFFHYADVCIVNKL